MLAGRAPWNRSRGEWNRYTQVCCRIDTTEKLSRWIKSFNSDTQNLNTPNKNQNTPKKYTSIDKKETTAPEKKFCSLTKKKSNHQKSIPCPKGYRGSKGSPPLARREAPRRVPEGSAQPRVAGPPEARRQKEKKSEN